MIELLIGLAVGVLLACLSVIGDQLRSVVRCFEKQNHILSLVSLDQARIAKALEKANELRTNG